jgi:hypothetical protein
LWVVNHCHYIKNIMMIIDNKVPGNVAVIYCKSACFLKIWQKFNFWSSNLSSYLVPTLLQNTRLIL